MAYRIALLLAASLMTAAAPAKPLVEGLDHTPVAVRDLYDLYPDYLIDVDAEQALLAQAERAMRDDVIIGSSTSGLLPTRLQSGLKHPERFVVGHPFNPVYLMPLVEVCGGAQTSDLTKQRAAAFW